MPAGASVFTFGDFNRRHPDWDNRKPKPDRLGRELRDWAAERDLAILNDGSVTREQAGLASSPDVTLCPDAWREHCSWRVLDCHGSDHLPLQTDIRLASPPVRNYRRPRWSWKKARWDEFTAFTELAFETLGDKLLSAPLHIQYDRFAEIVMDGAKRCIPRGCGRRRPRAWWCDELDQKQEARRAARKEAAGGGAAAQARYKAACKDFREAVRDAKEATWQDYASSLDCRRRPAEVWATVHEMDGNVPTTQRLPALRHKGKVLPTDAKKAAAFADMYAEVCRGRRGQGPAERRAERRRERALTHRLRAGACDPAEGICAPLTAGELDATLEKLPLKKAPGPDGMCYEFLKQLGPAGRRVLLSILDTSWRTGEVPAVWRRAEIIPLLKKHKDANDPASYRPVALTCCTAKLIEHVAKLRLQHFLEDSGALPPEQAGFRWGRSTTEQILRVTQDVADGLAEKQ